MPVCPRCGDNTNVIDANCGACQVELEDQIQRQNRWMKKNPDYHAQWYQDNRDRLRQAQRDYYVKNREKLNARKRERRRLARREAEINACMGR